MSRALQVKLDSKGDDKGKGKDGGCSRFGSTVLNFALAGLGGQWATQSHVLEKALHTPG